MVQNSPARPKYSEHSFVTWRSPRRWEDADNDGAALLFRVCAEVDGAVGEDDRPSHAAPKTHNPRIFKSRFWIGYISDLHNSPFAGGDAFALDPRNIAAHR